jgi:Sigma-70 region 2
MPDRDHVAIFEAASPMLMGLAYRMLGSRADAEDAVQDTFLNVLRGKAEVLDFIARNLRQWWGGYERLAADVNAGRGFVLRHDGVATAAVSFAYDEAGRATSIYIVRNPDKLSNLTSTLS